MARSKASAPGALPAAINVRGARHNNLRHVDVDVRSGGPWQSSACRDRARRRSRSARCTPKAYRGSGEPEHVQPPSALASSAPRRRPYRSPPARTRTAPASSHTGSAEHRRNHVGGAQRAPSDDVAAGIAPVPERTPGRAVGGGSLYVFDEPATGLHPLDVATLVGVFDRLLKAGATIIVIDHDLDLLAAADHLIDMGPGGGPDGGRILAAGTPQDVTRTSDSVTGPWLAEQFGVPRG